jgi:hypothetical protein
MLDQPDSERGGSRAVESAINLGAAMADNPKERGPQDRSRVNVEQDYERRWWSQKWNVSEDKLREAVKAAGSSASAVAKHLGKSEA